MRQKLVIMGPDHRVLEVFEQRSLVPPHVVVSEAVLPFELFLETSGQLALGETVRRELQGLRTRLVEPGA